MTESKEELNEHTELLLAAQLEKLRLEIDSLRSKNKWEDRVARYIPLMTVLLALMGLFFGIWQFQGQQRLQQDRMIAEQQKDRASQDLDRVLRVQTQIRTDTDQLLQFTNNPEQTISRVSFLIEDLKALAQQPLGESPEASQIIAKSKETVTQGLIKMIHYDCDFMKNPRDVYFATTVIDHWDDYSQYLGRNLRELDFILYKYLRALRDLHDRNPKYFERIVYDSSSGRYIVDSETFNEEHQFQHYGDIVIGFIKHWSLLKNSDLMKKHIADFKAALRNPVLTKQLFAEYLPGVETAYSSDHPASDNPTATDRVFILTPSAVRAPAEINKLVLDRSVNEFTFSLRLPSQYSYKSHRASVFDLDGKRIWQTSNIAINRAGTAMIVMPSSLFTMGYYVLAIDGEQTNGQIEALERYYFQIAN